MIPLLLYHYWLLDDIVLIWVTVVGLIAFVLMGYDKLAAKISTNRRLRERNFWLVAALGGFIGVGFGAIVFHHKVSKKSFWPPVAASIFVWLALFYLLKIL